MYTQETQRLMEIWINNHPESEHPFDTTRFHEFVFSAWKNDEGFDEVALKACIKDCKSWIDEFLNEFLEEKSLLFSQLTLFLDFVNGTHKIK